jgi:hypothetical protein
MFRNITWPDATFRPPPDNVFEKCKAGCFRNPNNNKCEQCKLGFYRGQNDVPEDECLRCKTLGDVYSDTVGASACTRCPAYTQRKLSEAGESGEADSASLCECIAGACVPRGTVA